MATGQDFTLTAGDTRNIEVTVDSVNLSGATVKWAVKKTVYDAEYVLYKDTDAGITVTGAAAGEFTIPLKPEDTAGLSGNYVHEAEITDASGNVSTILTGTMTVKLGIIN
ncbi:hypothetical protein M6D81_11580 [Paenibacillus sp. J5C_2022]|uniref:hypothetical protein n=1 Tax=Paenibacillus sp. J5C2022 TaxID=2977129 RepID=UPI0021D0FD44|nr:hypothetical protein [Paenibacillus sp. J5C2022]MCU6709348.1 hypothetical protein [Paenibacillus sp. J5C2022]